MGAGIAGPKLAYWMLRAGHQPTLVEWAPELRRGGYLVDFWGAGFHVAERMGIVDELGRRRYRFTEARAVDNHGRRIAWFDPSAVVGSGKRYVTIVRSDLAALIFDALEDGAELTWSWFRPKSARSSRSRAACDSPGTWTSTQAASWVG